MQQRHCQFMRLSDFFNDFGVTVTSVTRNCGSLPSNMSSTSPLLRIRQDVQAMHAYAIQESTGLIKLDAMENPYVLPEELQAELGQRLGRVAVNRYPGQRAADLQAALARYIHLPEGCTLMLGNGSDELISLLALACDRPTSDGQPATILAPLPGFVMYAMSAQLQGLRFVGVDLTADFELDVPAMLAAMNQHRPAIVYLAYPNNPTANLWDDEAIEQIVVLQAELGGLVVMDEAYQPFAARSYLERMAAHRHVLLMRTLSKFGLAGVRLGYMVGPKELVAEVDKVRPPYNVSVLNAECALFALEHADVFAQQAEAIRISRSALLADLAVLPGVKVFPSEANMVLVRVPDAGKTFEGMKRAGVLVKNVSKMHPLLSQCLRLTVGTPEENRLMLAALQNNL